MVAAEMKTKDDIWCEIRDNFIEMLTEVLCDDNHDPHAVIRSRARAAEIADRLVHSACQVGGGRDGYYWPRVPHCLRLVRNRQLKLNFRGTNYAEIGAAAPFLQVKSRQVRKILKLKERR